MTLPKHLPIYCLKCKHECKQRFSDYFVNFVAKLKNKYLYESVLMTLPKHFIFYIVQM